MNEQQPSSNWQFKMEDEEAEQPSVSQAAQTPQQAVSWSASEFVAHEKDFGWFAALGVGTALLMLVVFLLTKDYISTGVVLVVAVIFGIYAIRVPRVLQYSLDNKGVQIDKKHYGYDLFKSFTLLQEGGIRSIELMPLRRFMPAITMYIDPEDEAKITQVLSNYLPFEPREQPMVDKLMRRLRF